MNPAAERASFYIAQDRYKEALKELSTAVAQDPDDSGIRGLMALCLLNTNQKKQALEEAQRAVALAPDYDWAHYVLAMCLVHLDRNKQAEASIRRAIELDPDDAGYYALLAGIYADDAKWKAAIDACEWGLSIDPDNETCRTIRAHAMSLLGDRAGAHEAAIQSVMENPDSPNAHAALGWVSLRAGKRAEATQHFKESLRMDPEDEMAKDGLLESLRTGFPPYRMMFDVTQYIARLPGKFQWLAIFGLYVTGRVAGRVLKQNQHLWPFLAPVVAIIGLFFLMRWFGQPITNSILLFHPLGRLALGPARRTEAILFSSFLLIGSVLLLVSALSPAHVWVGGAVALVTALILGLCHSFETGKTFRPAAFWIVSGWGAIGTVIAVIAAAMA